MEEAQLARWFEAHGAPLVLYARQWLDVSAAEDVVQNVFVRLMLQRKAPDNVRAWLYRAVRNEAISQWRSHRRRQTRERYTASDEWYFQPTAELLDAQAASDALRTLPEPRREIIILRIWAQMTLQEISTITGSPVSTVFHHYQEGLRAVRARMELPCKTKEI